MKKLKSSATRKLSFFIKAKKIIDFNKLKFKDIRYVPIIDKHKKILELIHLSSIKRNFIDTPFVIIAGGSGKRLLPLTKNIPKPLVKLNNKPIIEHIIDKAINEGFSKFYYLHRLPWKQNKNIWETVIKKKLRSII